MNKTSDSENRDVPVIAIDGPSGSGKGVITQRLAGLLGFHILDSGALYRLVGLSADRAGVDLEDPEALAKVAKNLKVEFLPTGDPEEPLSIQLDGEDVTRDIRTDEAGVLASKVSPLAQVRDGIMVLQHSFRQSPGLVADGRDMGTVVFTSAQIKVYLTASAQSRAERRYKQLKTKGISVSLHALFDSIKARDERDMTRKVAPLRPADDALIIDSTDLSIDEVFAQVQAEIEKKLGRIWETDNPS